MYRRGLPGSGNASSNYSTISLIIYAAWVILIFGLAFQPFEAQDLRPMMESIISEDELRELLSRMEFPYAGDWLTREPYIFIQFIIRKAAHLFFYGVLAFLVVYQQLQVHENAVLAFGRALIIVVLVGSADEGIQYLHKDRTGMVEDVVLNISGSVFALLWLAWRAKVGLNFHRDI